VSGGSVPLQVVIPVSTPWPPTGSGGIQTFVQALGKVAHEVDMKIQILGVGETAFRSESLRFVPVATNAESEFGYARALKRAVAKDPSLLPSDGVVLANAEHYVWALRGESLPIVLMAHGVISMTLRERRGPVYTWLFRHLVERPAVRRVTKIVAVNEEVGRYYTSRYPRESAGKVVPVVVGVVLEDYDRRPRHAVTLTEEVDAANPILLFVGRLSPEKNVDLFVQSCDALASSGARFTGLVVGDGPEAAHLRELQKTRRWLRWLPALPHDQLLDLMAVASALGICSSYEGLPTVLLEAVASGLPVVSTDVGRSRELLHRPIGIVAEASPEAFASAFRQLMTQDRGAIRAATQPILTAIDFRTTAHAVAKVLRDARAAGIGMVC
jgi:glycosyltransferase involved in cell wall biosynthesis